jgi:hypothetical protein
MDMVHVCPDELSLDLLSIGQLDLDGAISKQEGQRHHVNE